MPSNHKNEANKPEDQPRILKFKVMNGDRPPDDHVAFVSVKYRGHWFYITRPDKNSKKLLSVLTELFVERAGKPATTATTLAL